MIDPGPVPTTEAVRARRAGALPDFLVIGAMKAGTTSMFEYLAAHPQVCAPVQKEIHFFSQNFRRGEAWYRGHFPSQWRLRLSLRRRITGEATPGYLFHEKAPGRIRQLVPQARLIALLRDPVERAWSQYQHQRRAGHEQRPFRSAIEAELAALSDASAGRRKLPSTYLARGLYLRQLKQFAACFPSRQMLVLRAEDLFSNPLGVLREVAGFLAIDPDGWRGREALIRPYNQHRHDGGMDAERAFLQAFFEPHNRALQEHLGRDLGWAGPAAADARPSA